MKINTMKKSVTLLLSLFVFAQLLTAQDQHFSQFYSSPLTLNPGFTGVFNGDIRAYTLYRMQWFTVTTPYKTFTVSLDGPIFKKKMKNQDFFSAGINFSNDNQGTVRMKTNAYNAMFSFTKFIGGRQKHNITLGYEIGYATRSATLATLKWDSQWDGTEYYAGLPSGEPGGGAIGYMDMSTGLVWNFNTDHLFRSAMGFSFQHFTAPNVSLVGGYDKLYPKLGFQWLVNYKLSETSNTTLEPALNVAQQGSSVLVDAGLSAKFVLSDRSHYTDNAKDKAFHIGIYYRLHDAMFVTFKYDFADFTGSLAYDVNISGLTPASHTVGGFELMLAYRGIFFGHKNAKRNSVRFM